MYVLQAGKHILVAVSANYKANYKVIRVQKIINLLNYTLELI